MLQRTIFSGIQPTGIPQLGNYLGALSNWLRLQNTSPPTTRLFFSIVGLHALTIPQNPAHLLRERRDMLASLLALGLDHNRATIFQQDQVPQHAELAWILNCITPVGWLRRMTTWKAKLAQIRNSNNVGEVDESLLGTGLLAYPVLQAADILLYNATDVPVGEDQRQHLELAREIAKTYNRTYKTKTFVVPRMIQTDFPKVLSLRDPTRKMSKSDPLPASRISLLDSPKEIEAKIKSATTDSQGVVNYDTVNRPGISNLISIYASFLQRTPEEVGQELQNEGIQAPALKARVAEAVTEGLRSFRNEYRRIRDDEGYLTRVEQIGREKASSLASVRLAQIHRDIGLLE